MNFHCNLASGYKKTHCDVLENFAHLKLILGTYPLNLNHFYCTVKYYTKGSWKFGGVGQ